MDKATFEQERLALFARYGFEGESRWITDRDGRRSYLIDRNGGGCPTVLIHGGLSQAGEWALLAGRLPGHVIIPDRPACGLSYPIDYRRVDFRKAATDWVLQLTDAIEADEIDLVGSSMGGFFSMAFALAHPGRVRRLVLLGAPPGLGRDCPFFIRLWGTPVTGHLISKIRIKDPETNRKWGFSNLVAHPEALPLDILENDIAAMAIPGVDRSSYTMLRAITTLRGLRPDLLLHDEMAHLDVRTLFLWGDADKFVPMSRGKETAGMMSYARFEVIQDAGHMLHLDQPDTVAAALTRFLGHPGPLLGNPERINDSTQPPDRISQTATPRLRS
jgi:pimeloyl-ACP methyl ester carboxylesterase